jgi:hypothetical protein
MYLDNAVAVPTRKYTVYYSHTVHLPIKAWEARLDYGTRRLSSLRGTLDIPSVAAVMRHMRPNGRARLCVPSTLAYTFSINAEGKYIFIATSSSAARLEIFCFCRSFIGGECE